jgi:cytochrome c551/c552
LSARRQLVIWLVAALATTTLLVLVLAWQQTQSKRLVTSLMGDPQTGARIFERKGCPRCHSVSDMGIVPDVAVAAPIQSDPSQLVTAMWNHAPRMLVAMQHIGMEWPQFQGSEMTDLVAYIREGGNAPRLERELLPADPGRGWKTFQSKGGCIACHSVPGEGGRIDFASRRQLPATFSQFAEATWNHSPPMLWEMQAQKVERPKFRPYEMADLMAFFNSLGYFEPTGSPQLGEGLFKQRGCSRCHGPGAEGTASGPALRRRDHVFTSITLAAALWRHGPEM